MNRYEVFVKLIEKGSFTAAAEDLHYTQSAVSQMIHTLEEELSTTLILRSRGGVELTPDGTEYLPYIKAIAGAHRELQAKNDEMKGLQGGKIRIGTFTSVSRNWLPRTLMEFKKKYPYVQFELLQGEYTNISQWIQDGSVDFGFMNLDAVRGLDCVPLQIDHMMAVLPQGHPLTAKKEVTLAELSKYPFILLDEGKLSVPLIAFKEQGLVPDIQYKVSDDYTIMAMVEQGLGISILYSLVLENRTAEYQVRPIKEPVMRTIALAYKNKKMLPVAGKYFIDFLLNKFQIMG